MNEFETLKTIRDLSHPGIFCLYNPKKNKAFVSVAINVAARVSEIMKQLETGDFACQELIDDRNDLELYTLETYKSVPAKVGYNLLKGELSYHLADVRNRGIGLYDNKLTIVSYKAKIDFVLDKTGKELIVVEAVTKRYNKQLVGVFTSIEQAKKFVNTFYKNPINKLVTAYNQLTKQYLSSGRWM